MEIYKAKVTATNERLTVYKTSSGYWYDYENMATDKPPSAVKAGKKMFSADELELNKKPIRQ